MHTAIPALAELGYDGIEIPLKAILQYGKNKFKFSATNDYLHHATFQQVKEMKHQRMQVGNLRV